MSERVSVETRLGRIEEAIRTLSWWLVQAQTGFGQQDARGIDDILDGKDPHRLGDSQ